MKSSTKKLCRAGVIAALYAALTYVFAPFAFGTIQIRPSEALCLLPLFFPEAIPALFVGCVLSNLSSPYFFYDILVGSTATLLAAVMTYVLGRALKKTSWKLVFGGLFPVLINALCLPLLLFLTGTNDGTTAAYFAFAGGILLSESLWVYGLGVPLLLSIIANRRAKDS